MEVLCVFAAGDKVVYHHDVCVVKGLEEAYANDEDYLGLEALFKNALIFHIPVRSCDKLLRPVITREQALKLIDSLPKTDALQDPVISGTAGGSVANHRLRESYREYLRSSDIDDLIPLLKAIYQHIEKRYEKGKTPSSADRDYFNEIETMLYNELAVALEIDRDDIKGFVEERLEGKA